MNPLDTLKERLKVKPVVQHVEGIKVIIGPTQAEAKQPTRITIDDDEGKKATTILERMRRYKLTNVTAKFPEVKEQEEQPIVIEPKIKKLKKEKITFVLQEEEEPVDELLPEGAEMKGTEEEEEKEEKKEYIQPKVTQVNVPRERITKRQQKGIIELGPEHMVIIGDTSLPTRLPRPPVYELKSSKYYMNNREIFVNFINNLFQPYKEDLMDESKGISCDTIGRETSNVGLLTHQKIVRDYINLYTPYRGLLLYHGLGSGKTCSSIAIAEGLKNSRKVIVMTPASLRRNYIEEIKKCGDLLYRKNQYWEWISIDENPEFLQPLSASLNLSQEYIRRKRGAWLVNVTKENNYTTLTTQEKKTLNDQIDEMIQNKYTFINYNGLRRDKFRQLTNNFETNIFDNSVVIIDEAHNLISRIVNKINKTSKFSEKTRGHDRTLPTSLALQIYEFLLRADNCRVVLLSGTPIINYPNEIAILYNILRGYIKTWNLTLNVETTQKISKEILMEIFAREKILDYVDYSPSSKILTITRNPYGFENKITETGYKGVTNEKKERKDEVTGKIIIDERGTMTDSEFIIRITKLLKKNNINVVERGTNFNVNTALPDSLDEFINNFIDKDSGNVSNIEKFKRRIIGLTSYFRSAQEELLPKYDKVFNKHILEIPMSNYQFQIYEEARQEERVTEKGSKMKKAPIVDKDGLFKDPSSTYRIFSRLFCNFVMPKQIGRPKPPIIKRKLEEKQMEEKKVEEIKLAKVDTAKAEGKVEKDRAKAQTKAEKERAKAEAKAEKERAKAEAKAEKERAKADAKAEKERAKAEAKAEKERAKAEAKAQKSKKGGYDDNNNDDISHDENNISDDENNISDDENNISDDENNISDDENNISDEDNITQFGGSSSPYEDFLDRKDPDEILPIKNYKDEDAKLRDIDELEGDEVLETMGDDNYKTQIDNALMNLKQNASEYLSLQGLETYSPKYLTMIENIKDPEHQGLHLIYSQFRSMEGIGIFAMALEANGFAEFKIRKTGLDTWEIDMTDDDIGKPTYALYTGTEEAEEREIIRNIYNGSWDNIPNNIATQLRMRSNNNNLGEIIKVLMITSAGSEGINLRNTRYVHIMEPYWHPVRIEQVIGRARRICSHKDLPLELQTVDVYIYIMVFTKEQLDSDYAIELKLKDQSKRIPNKYLTSDEALFEISNIKEQLTSQLLKAIKETSIDCATYSKSNINEGLVCLSFGHPNVSEFSYNPNYTQDENDTVAAINKIKNNWPAEEIFLPGIGQRFFRRVGTNLIYDYDSVIQSRQIPGIQPILIGKLVKNSRGNYELIREV
jgi:hypothetical protein